VWACNGQPQQRWTYDRTARAVRAASGLCLDVHAPELTTNGGRVQVWACNGQQQQQWASLANGSLQNAGGLCLDVHAPDQANDGGRVQVWQCNSSQQQRFTSSVFKSKASSPVAVDGLHSLAQVSALQAEKADTKASAPEDDAVVGGNAIVAGSQVEVALGTSSSTENDTDRPGADFSNFTLSPGSASACRGYCIKDSRCKAWTYVRPRIQGPSAVCYLKNAMPPATPNNCCVSGVVPRGPVGVSPNLPPPASQN
jgi:hypothetical protein